MVPNTAIWGFNKQMVSIRKIQVADPIHSREPCRLQGSLAN